MLRWNWESEERYGNEVSARRVRGWVRITTYTAIWELQIPPLATAAARLMSSIRRIAYWRDDDETRQEQGKRLYAFWLE